MLGPQTAELDVARGARGFVEAAIVVAVVLRFCGSCRCCVRRCQLRAGHVGKMKAEGREGSDRDCELPMSSAREWRL
jgi:hypothetical protein